VKKVVLALTLLCLSGALGKAQESSGVVLAMPAVIGSDPRMVLIRRTEVQNHLRLSLAQKQALAEMLNDPSRAGVRFSVRSEGTPDQKRMREDLNRQIEEHQKGMHDQLAQVLRPQQMARLSELALQWRGLMALNDSQVAEQIGLNGEQRSQIAQIVSAYQREKSRALQTLTQKSENSSPDGSAKMVMVRLNLSELDKPLSPVRKALEAAREHAEKQIMSLLTETQRRSWRQAQGEPFTFKAEKQATRF
jgi:hypothetical protein